MGRPYLQELQELELTYAVARTSPAAAQIASFLRAQTDLPLVFIGSGGAYSAARFMASVAEHAAGETFRVLTPLEALSSPRLLENSRVVIVSASGGNKDIVAATKLVLDTQGTHTLTLCASSRAKIHALGASHSRAAAITVPMGGSKDGFLAVNSVLSFATVFTEACRIAYDPSLTLPSTYEELISGLPEEVTTRSHSSSVWTRNFLVVLHGTAGSAAAVDLESKCTEAGIIACLSSDLRNFAHGRHHWLAKRGEESAVLCYSSPQDERLATKTLGFIPAKIPRVHCAVAGNFVTCALRSIVATFHIAQKLAANRGIDPGRPGVPPFGSKIYSLGPSLLRTQEPDDLTPVQRASRRKQTVLQLQGNTAKNLQSNASDFLMRMKGRAFRAVVFDYDGTLVSTKNRLAPITASVTKELNRILALGLKVAICTGRGKSVIEPVKRAIEARYHASVFLSLYNGTAHTTLEDGLEGLSYVDATAASENGQSALGAIRKSLAEDFAGIAELVLELRPTQLTVSCTEIPIDVLWHVVAARVAIAAAHSLKAVRSSHSVDVIPLLSGKMASLSQVRGAFSLGPDSDVLFIGDMARWPGNDAEMFAVTSALSVDESSTSCLRGWNFSPFKSSGPEALVYYLEGFSKSRGEIRWSPIDSPKR